MSKTDVEKAVEAINQYFEFKIDFYESQKEEFKNENDLDGVKEAEEYINVFKNDWQEVISLVSQKTGYDIKDTQDKPDDFMEMLKEKVMNGENDNISVDNNDSFEDDDETPVKKSYIETLQEQMAERKRQREIEREELRKERMRIREKKWAEKEKNKMTPKQTAVLTGITTASAFAIGRKIGKSAMK